MDQDRKQYVIDISRVISPVFHLCDYSTITVGTLGIHMYDHIERRNIFITVSDITHIGCEWNIKNSVKQFEFCYKFSGEQEVSYDIKIQNNLPELQGDKLYNLLKNLYIVNVRNKRAQLGIDV